MPHSQWVRRAAKATPWEILISTGIKSTMLGIESATACTHHSRWHMHLPQCNAPPGPHPAAGSRLPPAPGRTRCLLGTEAQCCAGFLSVPLPGWAAFHLPGPVTWARRLPAGSARKCRESLPLGGALATGGCLKR